MLAVGQVAGQVSASFNKYWNSALSYPISTLVENPPTPAEITQSKKIFDDFIAGQADSEYLQHLRDSDLANRIRQDRVTYHWGVGDVVADDPQKLVHAGYARYRHALLRMGMELYELNRNLSREECKAIKEGVIGRSKSSLHAKCFVLDRETAFIGSLNLDPRSIIQNTEIGVVLKSSPIERRNRALIACTLLTGARDRAIASMKLKHVDLIVGSINQDAREVKTKFSKTFNTFFFPGGEEIREIMAAWVSYLRDERLWGNDDPLFPKTRIVLGAARQFEAAGLARGHCSTASPIRTIFRKAFVRAGLPYFNPHSFRNTLVQLGQDVCKTPDQFKAWSQNLRHEKVLTTFLSYGEVACQRQGEIIRGLATPQQTSQSDANEIAEAVFNRLRESGVDMQVKETDGVSVSPKLDCLER